MSKKAKPVEVEDDGLDVSGIDDPETEPEADPETDILVDFAASGDFAIVKAPLDSTGQPRIRERALTVQGINVEHVSERDDVWCYRKM